MAVDWPDIEELKQVLDVASDDWDGEESSGGSVTRLTRLLAAAIARVKTDVGDWDEMTDEPDEALSQAALRMAELFALRPEVASGGAANDPTYARLLKGHRRAFGIA